MADAAWVERRRLGGVEGEVGKVGAGTEEFEERRVEVVEFDAEGSDGVANGGRCREPVVVQRPAVAVLPSQRERAQIGTGGRCSCDLSVLALGRGELEGGDAVRREGEDGDDNVGTNDFGQGPRLDPGRRRDELLHFALGKVGRR